MSAMENAKASVLKNSRIKECRRKGCPDRHNCPQCGQFPGVKSDLIPEEKMAV